MIEGQRIIFQEGLVDMREQYELQLKQLNNEMIHMGSLIENAIEMAITALINSDVEKARNAIDFDDKIDQEQKDIEQLCMKLLLTQQPVASDLRMVSTALKMVTDMERIGDHAADISEITIMLSGSEYIKKLELLKKMASETTYMVIKSIEAYVEKDVEKAKAVINHDDIVDDLFIKEKNEIVELIAKDPSNGSQAADLLMVAKYFERIGDHATNIAEWAMYAQTGDINVIQ